MLTPLRLLATCVGYIVLVMWLLGLLNLGEFVLIFRVKQ